MNAANAAVPSPSHEEEMRAHEPSMEEILASIRRIIADDDSLTGARREGDDRRRLKEAEERDRGAGAGSSVQSAYPAPALERLEAAAASGVVDAADEDDDDLNEWAPSVAEIRPLRIARRAETLTVALDASSDAEAAGSAVESDDAADEEASALVSEDDVPLMSPQAASAIASQFHALAASMLINDSGLLQKYAQEMMRPMLKQWLDDNLPVIVERLVRAEIERVARSARR